MYVFYQIAGYMANFTPQDKTSSTTLILIKSAVEWHSHWKYTSNFTLHCLRHTYLVKFSGFLGLECMIAFTISITKLVKLAKEESPAMKYSSIKL